MKPVELKNIQTNETTFDEMKMHRFHRTQKQLIYV
jgi:hypothetical protein